MFSRIFTIQRRTTMKLIYKHDQEHHFKIIRYPDGQQSVELDLNYFNDPKTPITVACSVRNWKELEVLSCLVTALAINDFTIEGIEFNFLMGMRSDRKFSPGQPNYFRDVLAPLINRFPCPKWVLYPHSKVSLLRLDKAVSGVVEIPDEDSCFVIGADASAMWHSKDEAIPHFNKKRTPEGVEIYLPHHDQQRIKELPEHTPILVKDDLCDGGATFIAIAEYLAQHFPERKRYLFVAHGLFTKGIDHVAQHWDKVITTNSYREFEEADSINEIEVLNVWT